MTALELRPGATFDPAAFETFLAEQTDLGTKWAPRFVRIVDAIPVTGADKIAKLPLRTAAWNAPAVWWRPARVQHYAPFGAQERATLESAFATHNRTHALP
jgi:fatty-acyl-CoA synthase